MSNKPLLPNAYVDINNRNLGFSPSAPSGIYAFIGIGVEGSAVAEDVESIGNLNEVRTKIGYGALADALTDFFMNGGRKAVAVRIAPTTESTIGSVSKTAVGTSTGTITLAKKTSHVIPNKLGLKVVITKTGDLGEGKFKYSTDSGENYSPEIIIPAGGTYEVPTFNLIISFVKGGGAVYFENGDYHTSTITAPEITNALIGTAADDLIASDEVFDAIVVVSTCDTTLLGTLKSKAVAAEAKPNFRYFFFMVRPEPSTSAADAISNTMALVAAVQNDRIQIIASEMICVRPNHVSDFAQRNVIGIIAGRRSSLAIAEDVGLFSAGGLTNIVRPIDGWTETTIEDLDALRVATVRKFKGVAGFFPTNGWMTDPFSDVKKDAWRLVLDKAANRARLTGLGFLKIKVNPSDIAESTKALKSAIEGALNLMIGDGEIVGESVNIPDGQDIMTTEEILVDIGVIPFGHASFIGIRIGLVNPLKA